mmetsp:Transcript_5782/g.8155  ORF Transcript_5782/g.8155 Transcript_5782/m.8155 type:complete len:410 (+) Transcript_5782:225-1454(+)
MMSNKEITEDSKSGNQIQPIELSMFSCEDVPRSISIIEKNVDLKCDESFQYSDKNQKDTTDDSNSNLILKSLPPFLSPNSNFFIPTQNSSHVVTHLQSIFQQLNVTFMQLSSKNAKWRCSKVDLVENCEFLVSLYAAAEKCSINCEFQFRQGSRTLFWNIFKPAKHLISEKFEQSNSKKFETKKNEPFSSEIKTSKEKINEDEKLEENLEESFKKSADFFRNIFDNGNLEMKMEAMRALAKICIFNRKMADFLTEDNDFLKSLTSTLESSFQSSYYCDFSYGIRLAGLNFIFQVTKIDPIIFDKLLNLSKTFGNSMAVYALRGPTGKLFLSKSSKVNQNWQHKIALEATVWAQKREIGPKTFCFQTFEIWTNENDLSFCPLDGQTKSFPNLPHHVLVAVSHLLEEKEME